MLDESLGGHFRRSCLKSGRDWVPWHLRFVISVPGGLAEPGSQWVSNLSLTLMMATVCFGMTGLTSSCFEWRWDFSWPPLISLGSFVLSLTLRFQLAAIFSKFIIWYEETPFFHSSDTWGSFWRCFFIPFPLFNQSYLYLSRLQLPSNASSEQVDGSQGFVEGMSWALAFTADFV